MTLTEKTMTSEKDSLAAFASRKANLGRQRLRHADTQEILLVPTPSNDPNDPLNWSAPKRYYVAALGCLGIFMCTFLAGGPGIAIPEMTITYFGPPGRYFAQDIAKVAYFLTVMPLTQGVGELFWMPLTVKYGRRPIYVASFALYTVTSLWAGFSPSYSSELAARIIMGCASGAAECLAPLTITDVFFLHQRGTMMSLYTASIACGAASGIIISGFITEHHTWRYIFHLSTAIIGTLTLLFFFTMPETMYQRDNTVQPSTRPDVDGSDTSSQPTTYKDTTSHLETKELEHGATLIAKKHSYGQDLRLFHVTYTKESFLRLFLRPIGLLLLPPILWAALVESATIGFYIAISSNFAVAFGEEYHFATWKIGLTYLSSIIGAILAIAFGGFLSDAVADFCTARNGGIREPEMRIPAIAISVITAPLGLVLYGVGIQNHLHWMVPTLGIGLLNFSLVQSSNIVLVYTIDSYRPISGEVLVSQLLFKSCFGFLLSFYTNPWIAGSGYSTAFGTMAAITGAIMLLGAPMYFFGKQIRMASLTWLPMRLVHWSTDRETIGE